MIDFSVPLVHVEPDEHEEDDDLGMFPDHD